MEAPYFRDFFPYVVQKSAMLCRWRESVALSLLMMYVSHLLLVICEGEDFLIITNNR